MATNGTTIGNNSKIALPLVITLLVAVLAVSGFAYTMLGGSQVHACNVDIHHPTAELDKTYARNELVGQQYSEITRRLDSIDKKLDGRQ